MTHDEHEHEMPCDECGGTGNDLGGLSAIHPTPCDWCGGTGVDPSVRADEEYQPCSECWDGMIVLDRRPPQSEIAAEERKIA